MYLAPLLPPLSHLPLLIVGYKTIHFLLFL
jgi:hypothetical protein